MKDLTQNKIIVDLISRWYQAFEIDHLFTDVKSIEKSSNCQTLPNGSQTSLPYKTDFNIVAELEESVRGSNFCFLKNTAKNTVFSDGSIGSKIMIIGEAPGAEEDEQGKPFVGQSGMLLNNMLSAIGLERSEVYISNILFWRPPGNRTPSSDEIASCMPFVHEHIRLADPKILLLLGGVAVKAILNTTTAISRLRGQINWYQVKNTGKTIRVIPTFHPAYLLRAPSQKALVFTDLLALKQEFSRM
jgi:DNA polymerase